MVVLRLNKKEAKDLFWLLNFYVEVGDSKYIPILDKLSKLKFEV